MMINSWAFLQTRESIWICIAKYSKSLEILTSNLASVSSNHSYQTTSQSLVPRHFRISIAHV